MGKPVILATGCDAFFYPYMEETLKSLVALGIDSKADIGILDFGLDAAQLQALKAQGFIVHEPRWTLSIPSMIKRKLDLGYVVRSQLREYFQGYSTYVWFDADAWAQTPEFFNRLVEGANSEGIAVIRENGSGYRRTYLYHRWWFGHMIATYGPVTGLKLGMKPAINNGIVALSDKAPHWAAWTKHYEKIITRRKKLNLEQHALNAAIELEHLPYALLPARCNWICTLSAPSWDKEKKLFCEPNADASPLSVLHLAGPDKRRTYQVSQTSGGTLATPVTYSAYRALA